MKLSASIRAGRSGLPSRKQSSYAKKEAIEAARTKQEIIKIFKERGLRP
jgi:hypothetical protein